MNNAVLLIFHETSNSTTLRTKLNAANGNANMQSSWQAQCNRALYIGCSLKTSDRV